MAEVEKPLLYNGPVEFGLRSALLMIASYPLALDLQRLVILDYFMVHSADIEGGPESLHAPSPMRAGELSIRRGFVHQGLQLLASRGLVTTEVGSDGIKYLATDLTSLFVGSLRGDFFSKLKSRARWAVDLLKPLDDTQAHQLMSDSSRVWRHQFVDLGDPDTLEV